MKKKILITGGAGYIGSMITEIFPSDSLIRVEKNNFRVSKKKLNQFNK